ncbi:LysR family transcriptional regulator [Corynebacterium sp. S7]
MDWNVREIRFFIEVVESGSFTDAAPRLAVSQAAVSRTVAKLEEKVGAPLLRRLPRGCELTPMGERILPAARRLMAEVNRFTEEVHEDAPPLRLGFAWSALGQRTLRLHDLWMKKHSEQQLHLIRYNSPTAGLLEGKSDVAITRRPIEDPRFESAVVGHENRVVAFSAADRQWARRRKLTMKEVAERIVIIDIRTGVTSANLWNDSEVQPRTIECLDQDDWLNMIATGQGVGTSSEATAYYSSHPEVAYRPISDGPSIPVSLTWWRDNPPRALTELISTLTYLYEEA